MNKITPAEQVVWLKGILDGKFSRLDFAKNISGLPDVIESTQLDYDCALAVMATLLATVNTQQTKTPERITLNQAMFKLADDVISEMNSRKLIAERDSLKAENKALREALRASMVEMPEEPKYYRPTQGDRHRITMTECIDTYFKRWVRKEDNDALRTAYSALAVSLEKEKQKRCSRYTTMSVDPESEPVEECVALRHRLEQAEAQLAAERDKALEDAAKVVRDYRWDKLHNECCEGNMGWLISKLGSAVRAIAAEEKWK